MTTSRRARLEDVIAGSELVFAVRRLAPDGLEAWKQMIECGYEDYVAKDEASVYEGGATRRWLKVKQKDWTVNGLGLDGTATATDHLHRPASSALRDLGGQGDAHRGPGAG